MHITLNDPWFEMVRDGRKHYEGRRNHGKVQNIKCGDVIEIRHHTNPDATPYNVRVVSILTFPLFRDALSVLPIQQVLPIDNITIEHGVLIYQQYVSLDTQRRDGVLMLELAPI